LLVRGFSSTSCATRRHLTGWDERPTSGLSQRPGEAGGSLTLEAQGGWEQPRQRRDGSALPDGPGPASKMGRCTYCRNQWWNPRKRETGSKSGGSGPGSSARPTSSVGGRLGRRLRWPARRPRGRSAAYPWRGCRGIAGHRPRRPVDVNVGTVLGPPSPPAVQAGGGQARRRLLVAGRDGAVVVVRGRESRPHAPAVAGHGEGRQRVRSRGAGRPGGRR